MLNMSKDAFPKPRETPGSRSCHRLHRGSCCPCDNESRPSSRDHFTLVGVEHIEARIRHHAKEIAYLMVWDRSDRSTEETVGRFELEDRNAQPYLEGDQGLPSEYGAEPVEPTDHGWADHDRRILAPSCAATTTGRSQVAPRPARKMEIPKPRFEDAAAEGGAKAMRELGHLYTQCGNIVIGSVDQLQGVNNSMNAQLHRQLRDARDQVGQLVAAILEYRHKQALSSDERDRDEREDDTRAMLARDATNQFGKAARAFLATRGLSP